MASLPWARPASNFIGGWVSFGDARRGVFQNWGGCSLLLSSMVQFRAREENTPLQVGSNL